MQIPKDILNRIAIRALELVHQQINEGIDIDGNHYQYSKHPFSRPAGGMPLKSSLKQLEKEGKLAVFITKQGRLWVTVKGGYRSYREMTGREPNDDFLTFTGKMLASLTAKTRANTITLGFSQPKEADLAYKLQILGVGRSKKLWKFLGLTKKNEEILKEEISKDLENNMIFIEQIENKIKIK